MCFWCVVRARSVVFVVLTLQNLLIAWELKSLDRSLFKLYVPPSLLPL